MPLDPITGLFARIWKFVDRFEASDDITRADLDIALDDFTPAINAAIAAGTEVQSATRYVGKGFPSRPALQADLTLTYATGLAGSVEVGEVIQVYGTRETYAVLAAVDPVPDLTTAGGVRLRYITASKEATTPIAFQTVSDLLADTNLKYGAGPLGSIDPGTLILTMAELRLFEVAPVDATTHTNTTAGGVKLFDAASWPSWLRLQDSGLTDGAQDGMLLSIFEGNPVWNARLGPHILLEDRKASGTAGGTFTQATDQIRVLNTEVLDAYDICTLSSNRFILPAGTYVIEFSAPASAVGVHQAFLYNVTAAATVFRGSTASASTESRGSGPVVITTTTEFEIRHRCTTTKADDGLGLAASFGGEVFTRVQIWKVA